MAFGGTRGLMQRWEPVLGAVALFLMLLSAAAAQEPSGAACSQNTNRTCEECLKNVSCLWCHTNKACVDYPVSRVLPPSSLCQLSSARWGVCWGKSSFSWSSRKICAALESVVVLSEPKLLARALRRRSGSQWESVLSGRAAGSPRCLEAHLQGRQPRLRTGSLCVPGWCVGTISWTCWHAVSRRRLH
uniref:PSI domain-containing protein n=1 Tax=Ursus americanus TaxID=9643 RepID=A0A452SQ32_URSAM